MTAAAALLLMAIIAMLTVNSDRPESMFVYLSAVSTLLLCVFLNWKALPIIYINVCAIALVNHAALALTPTVRHFEDLLTQAGG